MKKLIRSKKNRMIAGVCGGVSEYLNVDPTLLRIILAIIVLVGNGTFIFICGYIIFWFIIPSEVQ